MWDFGDWLDYQVNVATAGAYTMNVRVSSVPGGQLQLRSGATINVAATGGWQTWTALSTTVT